LFSQLRIIHVNPGSRLDAYEESVGLPYGNQNPFPPVDGPNRIYTKSGFFLLAHIRLQQFLNRGKDTRNPGRRFTLQALLISDSGDFNMISFAMASALEAGLADWYAALKPEVWFDSNIPVDKPPDYSSLTPKIDDSIIWLRSSHAFLPGYFVWPAVLEAINSSLSTSTIPQRYREAVEKFCMATMRYIISASQVVAGSFSPQVWPHAMG
jgi:hypothetical protein